MYLIKLEDGQPTGYPILRENFQQVHPDIHLPAIMRPEDVEPHGYGLYDFSMQPEHGVFEKLVEVAPVKSAENGVYYQTWDIQPMTDEEKTARTADEWAVVRMQRNMKLAACDWTQLADAPLSVELQHQWREYRTALRDVPTQADPFNIVWPVAPQGA